MLGTKIAVIGTTVMVSKLHGLSAQILTVPIVMIFYFHISKRHVSVSQ